LKKKGLWPPGKGTVFLPIDFQVAEMESPQPKPIRNRAIGTACLISAE
jgi:hypothetical protein